MTAGKLIGYARASNDHDTLAVQHDALQRTGCTRILQDTGLGSSACRPEFEICLDYLRAGDVLVVWRLDRLGCSLRELVALIGRLHARHVGFKSLTDKIDVTPRSGEEHLSVFRALADSERALQRERTDKGLKAARARGRTGGRPSLITPELLQSARAMRQDNQHTMQEIATTLGVSRATLYRHLQLGRRIAA
jgi:DNA invertase Pin-like site-specific DNA recombinase